MSYVCSKSTLWQQSWGSPFRNTKQSLHLQIRPTPIWKVSNRKRIDQIPWPHKFWEFHQIMVVFFPKFIILSPFIFFLCGSQIFSKTKNRWGILKSLRKGNDPKGFGYIWMSDLHNKTAFYGIIFCPFVSGWSFRLWEGAWGKKIQHNFSTPRKINMEPENASLEKVKLSSKPIIFRFYVNLPGCKPWLFSGTKNGLEAFSSQIEVLWSDFLSHTVVNVDLVWMVC